MYNKVKKLCEKKGITVSQLERDLGFGRSSICKWNENEPGVTKVQKVADYFKCTVDDLLREGEPAVAKVLECTVDDLLREGEPAAV